MKLPLKYISIVLVFITNIVAQTDVNIEHFGKMYSFDNLPIEKWNNEYNVNLDSSFYNFAMKSALQLGGGCSASFVSQNGLIMTNHHCVRDAILPIQNKEEDFLKDGFYADEQFLERKIKGMYVDQLVDIKDITNEILNEQFDAVNDSSKYDYVKEKIKTVEGIYSKKYNAICKVVVMYSGAKFVLHVYKRYNDIRLVMVPEFQIASTGWDWDNFTYPRYELDFAFIRAYDSLGVPVKTNNFFKWNTEGAKEGELTFVIGRPGSTNRLYSSEQLKYMRDYSMNKTAKLYSNLYSVFEYFYNNSNENKIEYLHNIMSIGNAKKSYFGSWSALQNENIFKDKMIVENKITDKINSDIELKVKYGNVFSGLDNSFSNLKKIGNEYETLSMVVRRLNSKYIWFAYKVLEKAEQYKLPDSLRSNEFKELNIKKTVDDILNSEYNKELQDKIFTSLIKYLVDNLGENNILFNLNGKNNEEYADYIIKNSFVNNKESLKNLLNMKSEEINNNTDPLLKFYSLLKTKYHEYEKQADEIYNTISNLNRKLGEMYFITFGTNFSPDATATLRITDGVIKGYEYNGTIAPAKTTYYGMFDRYYSFGQKEYPWGLPEKWINRESDFNYSTPLNFSSTHDIVGGNSGSAAINTKGEIIGLLFDGNYESLTGRFIYYPNVNRAVGVDSKGLLYSLQNIYKAVELVDELLGE